MKGEAVVRCSQLCPRACKALLTEHLSHGGRVGTQGQFPSGSVWSVFASEAHLPHWTTRVSGRTRAPCLAGSLVCKEAALSWRDVT